MLKHLKLAKTYWEKSCWANSSKCCLINLTKPRKCEEKNLKNSEKISFRKFLSPTDFQSVDYDMGMIVSGVCVSVCVSVCVNPCYLLTPKSDFDETWPIVFLGY